MEQEVSIIGGGIAGLAIAIALEKHGINPAIYESAQEMKPVGAGIALAFNAMKACKSLGVYEDVRPLGKSIEKALITNHKGKVLSSFTYANHLDILGDVTVALHRWDLQEGLKKALHSTQIKLGKHAIDFIVNSNKVETNFEDGTKSISDFVIACDGIHSVFRKKLIPKSNPKYSGYTCWRGIGILPETYPWKGSMIESWGPGQRLGIVPLTHNRVYWFAVKNAPEKDQLMKESKKEDILSFFDSWNKDMLRVIETTPDENIILSDISDIDPITNFAFDNILLVGDAAHATTPNLGQGGCQAIVDAAILDKCLEKEPSLDKAFRIFEEKRIEKTRKVILNSRKFGKLAQLENGMGIAFRNFVVGLVPEKSNAKQLLWLQEEDF